MADDVGKSPDGGKIFLSYRLLIYVFAVGVALVVVGFLLEEFGPPFVRWIDSFRHLPPPVSSNVGIDAGDRHNLSLFEMFVLLFKELGVAFVVASVVGASIEKKARERDAQLHQKMLHDLAVDAVFAIYGFRHERDFIKAAVETNLHASVVRQQMTMCYTLRELSDEEADLIHPADPADAKQRFVILVMKYEYHLKNVGVDPVRQRIPYSVPVRQGRGARQVTRVTDLKIDGVRYEMGAIDEGIRKVPAKDERFYRWPKKEPITLHPDKPVEVVIRSQCLKERSDNECWGCMYPTMGNLKLELTVLDGLVSGIREISNAELKATDKSLDPLTKTWEMQGPMLTHNSIVFWWRTKEDDAPDELDDAESDEGTQSQGGLTAGAKPVGVRGRLNRLIGR